MADVRGKSFLAYFLEVISAAVGTAALIVSGVFDGLRYVGISPAESQPEWLASGSYAACSG